MPISRIGTDGIDQTSSQQIGGISVGRGGGAVSTNTAVGASALTTNSSGVDATVVGYQAGYSSTGGYLTAVGYKAGYAVSSGTDNVFMGWNTGLSTTTGSSNVAMGDNAFRTNTTGGNNLALGHAALYSNTTASNNTAVGYQAAYSNTTGTSLVALGHNTLDSNTTGNNNIAIGGYAMDANTTGADNVAVGYAALDANTTANNNTAIGTAALSANTTASGNTAVGYQAGFYTTTATGLVAVGRAAGYNNTVGSYNVFIGEQAGYANTTSGGNTFIGEWAGYSTTGQGNTFVGTTSTGYGAGNAVTTGSKNTIIGGYSGNQGGLDIRTANNYIVLSDGDGNPRFFTNGPQAWAINSPSGYQYSELDFNIGNSSKAAFYWDNSLLRFYVGTSSAAMYIANGGTSWTSASDERAKDIIETISDAANKVSQLRAVIGKYKTDAEGTRRSFLIAQDVLAVLPEAVAVPDEGATEKDGSLAMMGVEYTAVIPLLVAAIKELKAEIDTLKGQA